MNIILWIVFGGLAGWIASMIAGTNKQQGLLGNIIVGILGAIIGGFIVNLLGGDGDINSFSLWNLLIAIGGAVLLLFVWKAITGRKGD